MEITMHFDKNSTNFDKHFFIFFLECDIYLVAMTNITFYHTKFRAFIKDKISLYFDLRGELSKKAKKIPMSFKDGRLLSFCSDMVKTIVNGI